MNPLKERKTAAITKTIATLFICASLLVGFMGMSLSFTQPAMAQQGPPEDTPQGPPEEDATTTEEEDATTTEEEDATTTITTQGGGPLEDTRQGPPADTPRPQCPDETDRFVRGQCEADPDLVCPPTAPPDAAGDCISPETKPKELQCPAGAEKRGDKCIESKDPAFRCPGGTREIEGKCIVQSGPNAGQERAKEPTCAPGQGGPGGTLVGSGATAKCERDVTAQGTQVCPSGTKEISGQCHVVVPKVPKCPSDEFDLIDPQTCQTRPGRGNA